MLEMLAVLGGLSLVIFLTSLLSDKKKEALFVDELSGRLISPRALAVYIMVNAPVIVGRNNRWFSVARSGGFYTFKERREARAECKSCDHNVIATFIIHHS